MSAADWPHVERIYTAGISGGEATFEREAPSWERWSAAKRGMPCLVARDGEQRVLGWAALTPVSARECYRGVGAVSIYVDPDRARTGVGKALLRALVDAAEQASVWTVEAGIFPENAASIALHEGCGFRLVGVRKRVGQMPDGSWRDVLLYERRSETVGVD
jgi:L-amino acid N-acyltransferase YncA